LGRSKPVFDLLIKLWPLGKVLNWAAGRPLLSRLLRPFFRAEGNEAIIIPVQETIHGTESVVLPLTLLSPIISQASHRFVLDECMCRTAEKCRTYPPQIGCLFLGSGVTRISPTMGRPVTVDEALAHARRAIEIGLVPLVVHAAFDAWILGIPYRQTLAVCFCCDCCCTVRHGLRTGPPAFWETVVRLPGLSVSAGPDCAGCGLCVDLCPVGAISLVEGTARIGADCKGCGRCAALCPNGAIALHLAADEDILAQLLARIEQRTDIWTRPV
jgi:ferredoxin